MRELLTAHRPRRAQAARRAQQLLVAVAIIVAVAARSPLPTLVASAAPVEPRGATEAQPTVSPAPSAEQEPTAAETPDPSATPEVTPGDTGLIGADPDVDGGDVAVLAVIALVVLVAVAGWWMSRRGNIADDGLSPPRSDVP